MEINPWPCGKLPKKWQRPELEKIKRMGYAWDDPRDIVRQFEQTIAEYAGSKYAVAVDSCTSAIFLCLQHYRAAGRVTTVCLPAQCYMSVPMAVKNVGFNVRFDYREWWGCYLIAPFDLYDMSVRFTHGLYIPETFCCLSFQIKKRLPIGKGGMILTDDEKAVEWFKQARFEGRHESNDQWHDNFDMCGWNMYMTPEDAARGLILFNDLPKVNPDSGSYKNYPDLTKQKVFK